jgi:hypothetical protein
MTGRIHEQIRTLVDGFEKAARGLFEITGRYELEYEQGVYGCAIAKPTKRMKASLGIDREVLVVASNFRDQQQRSIKFAKREIETSAGRYENTLAIVVHNDVEGNTKLRNWGRDQGLAILPLFGLTSQTSPSELERLLCAELYSHDPFDVTGPVSDDQNFYGRRDEAIELARKLQKGQIRSCLGIRKVGKTSIINRVLREMSGNHDCTCIMIDCSRDDVWELNGPQLINSLAQTIKMALGHSHRYARLQPSQGAIQMKEARAQLEEAVLAENRPLVLVFDEIDYITPGSPTRLAWAGEFNAFWRNLRSIYQECDRLGHTISILVGGVSTHWFTVESIEGVENAALSFIPEEYLSPMPEGATIAMLRRLGRIAGLQMDEDAAQQIARATGNMPYWARKCCSYIHRHIPISSRPCHIGAQDIASLTDSFVLEEGAAIAEVALRHLFRVHPQLAPAVRACHSGESSKVAEPLRRTLRRYGVLSPQDQLSGAMLSRAFDSLVADASRSAVADKVEIGGVGEALGEWAEELAALGKRRNILERKMREIVVNFIRFSALQSGNQSHVRDRISSILPESQRLAFKHLTAEDMVQKFLWTDLTKLIIKEWTLFERVFGDKGQFQSNADIVNDRYDAHAKVVDSADFALYRRALTHIEDKIARLQ